MCVRSSFCAFSPGHPRCPFVSLVEAGGWGDRQGGAMRSLRIQSYLCEVRKVRQVVHVGRLEGPGPEPGSVPNRPQISNRSFEAGLSSIHRGPPGPVTRGP